jgi:putative phosphoesterase
MKLMIASDIHGSAYYCKKLMEAYQKEKADKLLLLGDLLYHGPRNDLPKDYSPKEVISMLNSIKNEILCVRGNCEAEVDQMVLEFPIMADYILLFVDQITIFATHGHLYNENNLPPLKRGDILLHGHTHVQEIRTIGDIIYVNPGSVSIPKEKSTHSYAIFREGKFFFHTLD